MNAQQIQDILLAEDYIDECGIRTLHADEHPAVGDIMPHSWIWDDGKNTGEELSGTCAANIRRLTIESIQEAMDWIATYNIGEGSPRFALLVGTSGGRYNDLEPEAVIIRDARVLAVWS